eukprot:13453766-Alexandrium_andersonii.AAC.1
MDAVLLARAHKSVDLARSAQRTVSDGRQPQEAQKHLCRGGPASQRLPPRVFGHSHLCGPFLS